MSSGSFDSQASLGIVSSLVPVVGMKSKGTRNFVLSVFVPVVGVRVKGTMVRLGELKKKRGGARGLTLLSAVARGDFNH